MCKNYRNVWFQANPCVPKHTSCLSATHLACSMCRVAHARNIILMYVFVSNLQCILYTFKYVQATGKCDFNPTHTLHGTQILFLQHSACSKCRAAQARNNIFLFLATNLQVHTSTCIHIRQDVWFQANTLQSTQIAFQQHLACSKCGVAQLGIAFVFDIDACLCYQSAVHTFRSAKLQVQSNTNAPWRTDSFSATLGMF